MLSSEGSVGRADGVVQTEPVLTERKKRSRRAQKIDSIIDETEIDPVVTKKRKVPPQFLNQKWRYWNWKKNTKSDVQKSCLTLSSNQKPLQLQRKASNSTSIKNQQVYMYPNFCMVYNSLLKKLIN